MESVARFTIRQNGDKADLILGGNGSNSLLKAGRIYEIREVLGELTIVDIGPAEIKCEQSRFGATWNNTINHIINCGLGYALKTEQEYNDMDEAKY